MKEQEVFTGNQETPQCVLKNVKEAPSRKSIK
jgi:hypothetical protein